MASPPRPEDMAETITEQEVILEGDGRAISILVAREDVTVTEGRCPARATIAGPHIHQRHTDAFYVIGGELTFEVGRESEVITISPGGLVAVPPGVAHSFRNDGGRPAKRPRRCCSARYRVPPLDNAAGLVLKTY